MKFVRIYLRSLSILWKQERYLTLALTLASVAIGFIQITEPVLFGRVIDSLTKQTGAFKILALWGGLGALDIASSVFLAVMSDRLAHRQRMNILDQVFERVISLPVSYHSEQGSGKVVRAILSGTDQLFGLWLSFMREHLSSIVGMAFLVPLAISMDWRMASLLFVLALIYVFANFTILKRTHAKQAQIESYHQDLFGRIADVIGNVTVVQSYSRLWEEIQASAVASHNPGV
ncbi:MAG: glucan ABC transporter ATP-binding protein/ permease, partial [Proteobacteria bacterium]